MTPILRTYIPAALLFGICALAPGCGDLQRDNPLDPSAISDAGNAKSTLSLAVPLPKALATVVDSLVARLDVPNAPTIIKELTYDTPLGPAILTIGALSPGTGVTLTIEGYDLDGRLILMGTQTNITIAADDTTRVSIDLRLAIDPDDLETGDDAPVDAGTDTGDAGDTGDPGAGAGDTGTDTGTETGDTEADAGDAEADAGTETGDTEADAGDAEADTGGTDDGSTG